MSMQEERKRNLALNAIDKKMAEERKSNKLPANKEKLEASIEKAKPKWESSVTPAEAKRLAAYSKATGYVPTDKAAMAQVLSELTSDEQSRRAVSQKGFRDDKVNRPSYKKLDDSRRMAKGGYVNCGASVPASKGKK